MRPGREGQRQREVEVVRPLSLKLASSRIAVVDFLSGAEAGQRTDVERKLGGQGNVV